MGWRKEEGVYHKGMMVGVSEEWHVRREKGLYCQTQKKPDCAAILMDRPPQTIQV